MTRKIATLVITVMCVGMFALSASAEVKSVCIDCHETVTPQVVKDWKAGKMYQAGYACDICHGTGHTSASDLDQVKMPNADTCKGCHPEKVEQFNKGKHALAWAALEAMPKTASQPAEIMTGMKGCGGCHRIGYAGGKCDSCHTRHKFSKEEALRPEACGTCHMGFDHPQWEMWNTSKHGMIYKMEEKAGGDTSRAPKCQTCHMQDGNHAVMTAWGFLAVRLPFPEDPQWKSDRVTILQALNVLDDDGKPTPRYDVVVGAKVARVKEEDWQAERDKMLNTCSECHARSYAKEQLENGDKLIREADHLMAEAIRTVDGLYKDGILERPKDVPFSIDLLTFYDAPTSIEQTLYVMLLEHRMRTFQGAFHMNPDYMHWYGWAEMKKDLREIKDEAARLRKEHEMANK